VHHVGILYDHYKQQSMAHKHFTLTKEYVTTFSLKL